MKYDCRMTRLDRRSFYSFLALGGLVTPEAFPLQSGVPAPPGVRADTLGPARVFSFESLQERKTASGASWAITHGSLATEETVNLHESMQVAGAPPVQLHVIQHTEFILVSEGEVEYKHELNGEVMTERATAGSVLYIPTGTHHAVRNVGSGPARYLVVGIGGDAK